MRPLLPIALTLVPLTTAISVISDQCQVQDGSRVVCRCVGREEFLLPEGYNYENVTSLRVSTCATANLHFASLTEASRLEELIVQNVSERLTLELFLSSKRLKTFHLSNIRRIPLITHDTFAVVRAIDHLRIANARIDVLEEPFSEVSVGRFELIDVTVGRLTGVSFGSPAGALLLTRVALLNVSGSLSFSASGRVEIRGSKLALARPGHLLIVGVTLLLEDSVFLNASANLVAAGTVTVRGCCADGKSSLRVSADTAVSVDNRLPTEIVYTQPRTDARRGTSRSTSRNNTVCIAGNCRCPNNNSGGRPATTLAALLLGLAYTLWRHR